MGAFDLAPATSPAPGALSGAYDIDWCISLRNRPAVHANC